MILSLVALPSLELPAILAQTVSQRPMAPLWIVGPIAILTMLILAGHVHLTARICEPESRRRIRMATGMLALTIVPIATAALSLIPPANQRLFAVAWMLIAGLIVIVLLLAFLDMFNTFRIYLAQRREIRTNTRKALASQVRERTKEPRVRDATAGEAIATTPDDPATPQRSSGETALGEQPPGPSTPPRGPTP